MAFSEIIRTSFMRVKQDILGVKQELGALKNSANAWIVKITNDQTIQELRIQELEHKIEKMEQIMYISK